MTRTAAADAVMPACPRSAAACPSAAGTVVAFAGLAPRRPATRRPGRACLPFLRLLSGAPHQLELRHVRPLHRRPPALGNTATFAGWPADPGRDT